MRRRVAPPSLRCLGYALGAEATGVDASRPPDEETVAFLRRAWVEHIAVCLPNQRATPSPISFTQIYTALQTKLIDGESTGPVVIETSRYYEVERYISLTNHAWAGEWLVGNVETWNRFPPDLQAVVERNNRTYASRERRTSRIITSALLDKLRRRGIAINAVDQGPFRARLRPCYDSFAKKFGSTAWGLLQDGLGRRLT